MESTLWNTASEKPAGLQLAADGRSLPAAAAPAPPPAPAAPALAPAPERFGFLPAPLFVYTKPTAAQFNLLANDFRLPLNLVERMDRKQATKALSQLIPQRAQARAAARERQHASAAQLAMIGNLARQLDFDDEHLSAMLHAPEGKRWHEPDVFVSAAAAHAAIDRLQAERRAQPPTPQQLNAIASLAAHPTVIERRGAAPLPEHKTVHDASQLITELMHLRRPASRKQLEILSRAGFESRYPSTPLEMLTASDASAFIAQLTSAGPLGGQPTGQSVAGAADAPQYQLSPELLAEIMRNPPA